MAIASSGYTRQKKLADNVFMMPSSLASSTMSNPVAATQSRIEAAYVADGAAALDVAVEMAVAASLHIEEQVMVPLDIDSDGQVKTDAERRVEARMKGYEGDSCGECGNFTLLRNGTCMKCDTCGSTSGCS